MENHKYIHLNPKQLEFLKSDARVKVLVAGRGFGKTTVNGHEAYILMKNLPRSKGCLVGLTYRQLLTKVLPEMFKAWENLGLVEGEHYVVGKRPPRQWEKPISAPRSFDNLITICNGSCMELLSFDRGQLSRGGSYDWMILDEAVLFSQQQHNEILLPMIRGNIYKFPNNPHLHRRIYTSSQTWLESGAWVPDMAVKAQESPSEYLYMEGTAWDNIDVLGKKYLSDLKKELPYWTYQVEVMNMRIKRLPNCFYHELNEERHLYSSGFNYDGALEIWSAMKISEKDYDAEKPLELSFDFGSEICCVLVAQEHPNEERFIREFYRKRDDSSLRQISLLPALVQDIINHYRGHKSKVIVRGDRNGNNKRADSYTTFYEDILKTFRDAKFDVIKEVDGLDAFHASKHSVLNDFLSEKKQSLPSIRINSDTCPNLIISMQQSPILPDFKKDKRSEGNENILPEKATHFSDCFDNHFTKKKKYASFFKVGGSYPSPVF